MEEKKRHILITRPIWNLYPGTVHEVDEKKARFAIEKGRAILAEVQVMPEPQNTKEMEPHQEPMEHPEKLEKLEPIKPEVAEKPAKKKKERFAPQNKAESDHAN